MDDPHYVNEATLELLKWRIEADVKSRLWRAIGIPAGSVGILAILYVVFVAIPQYIEKSETVKLGLDAAVAKYLKDPERGQPFLQQQIEKITSLYGEGLVVTGDTLFAGSVGRTDFEGGSMEKLGQSFRRLMGLPEGTVVLSGHGPRTTIGHERRHNMFAREFMR